MKESEKLSLKNNDKAFIAIKKLFDKEMQGYYNLAWGIQVDTRGSWNLLEIRSPAFLENDKAVKDIQLKLQIERKKSILEYNQFDPLAYDSSPKLTIQGKGVQDGGMLLWDISNEKTLQGYKQIRVANSNALPDKNKNILTLYVSYPKLGERTKTFWDKIFADYFEGSITFEGFY